MPSLRATIEVLEQHVRYALRGMRARPAFTAAVTITMALGIGVDATMFGVLDRLLFRAPDGITHANRVFVIETHSTGDTWYNTGFSYPAYTDFRDHPGAFDAVGVVTELSGANGHYFPLGRGATGTRVAGALASSSFFTVLGVRPALGRFFAADEDDANHPSAVAVIGYAFWRRHFAGSPSALGKTLDIGSQRYTVIGVAPKGFGGIELTDVDVWLPITANSGLRFDNSPHWTTNRNAQWLSIVARVKPGASPALAAGQATAVYRASLREQIATNAAMAKWVHPDSNFVILTSIIPGQVTDGQSSTVNATDLRVARLLGLMAIVVLIIACANVANLLLVRAFDRRREIAVRLALGVTRARLAGQLVVEGLLLALAGGVGALVVARAASHTVRVWLFGASAWSADPVDGRLLAFTGVVTLATGLLTSLAPALQSTRADVAGALKAGVREGGAQRSRTRDALLVVQAALAIVLLAGAGLFVRSVRNVRALPFGIDVDHILVADFDHRGIGMSNADAERVYRDMMTRVRTLPGVRAAALAVGLPFNMNWSVTLSVPGRTLPKLTSGPSQYAVTDGYFDALGIVRTAGRTFTAGDGAGTMLVAAVNDAAVRLYWPTSNPIGQCVKIGADTMPCTTIVGVVHDTKRQTLVEAAVPQVYRPLEQVPDSDIARTVSFFGYKMVVRTAGDAAGFVDPVRRAMQAAASSVPYPNVVPMANLIGRHMRSWELGARVFTAFGALALLLAIVGLYSVTAFTVAQRVHELGVRAALGAQVSDLIRLTVTRSLRPVLAGLLAGVALALAAGRLVSSLLFGISAHDPAVLGAVSAVLLVAGAAASLVPALRASRVDPAVVLRAE